MDFLSVASLGFYPTPTPTGAARAAFVATYGLIDIGAGSLPSLEDDFGCGLGCMGLDLTLT